jgi:hypothetical protein
MNGEIEFVDTLANSLSFFDEGVFVTNMHISDRVVLERVFEVFSSHVELTGF